MENVEIVKRHKRQWKKSHIRAPEYRDNRQEAIFLEILGENIFELLKDIKCKAQLILGRINIKKLSHRHCNMKLQDKKGTNEILKLASEKRQIST